MIPLVLKKYPVSKQIISVRLKPSNLFQTRFFIFTTDEKMTILHNEDRIQIRIYETCAETKVKPVEIPAIKKRKKITEPSQNPKDNPNFPLFDENKTGIDISRKLL